MEVHINYKESYQRSNYIVINVTLYNNGENPILCLCSLSGAELREHETRTIVPAQKNQGVAIYPLTEDGVEHSFGKAPFEISVGETKTDNLVFCAKDNIAIRELKIVDLKDNNTELYKDKIGKLEERI